MAKQEITVIKCDKCGTESTDPSQFLHVQVTALVWGRGNKANLIHQRLTSRDLCIESCVGAPGVNRDK